VIPGAMPQEYVGFSLVALEKTQLYLQRGGESLTASIVRTLAESTVP
jgi:hypothetical protein